MIKQGFMILAIIFSGILFYGVYENFKIIQPEVKDIQKKTNDLKDSLKQYKNHIKDVINKQNNIQIKNISGSISNFEGPKIKIEYLNHHGKIWDKEQEPEFTFTDTELKFDPDHQDYGLPDLKVKLSQPRFISALENNYPAKYKSAIEKYLPNISNIRPIKSYTKTYQTKDGEYKKEKFDLYITEFDITIGIKPLRAKPNFELTSEEKRKKIFPRKWYQHDLYESSSRLISINDLKNKKEFKNQRYSKISVVFKIEPNNIVWYINDEKGEQQQANVAIGSIVSKRIKSNTKVKTYQEAQIIPGSPGINLTMYSDRSLSGLYPSAEIFREDPSNIDKSIFNNEPVYFRIISDNIGSWDGEYFWNEEWDDQFTIKFFMPLLVKGQFEIKLDDSLIPKYQAPEEYYNKFNFSDLLPDWGFDWIGKYISYAMIIFIIIIVVLFLPNLFALPNAILGRIAERIKSKKSSQ